VAAAQWAGQSRLFAALPLILAAAVILSKLKQQPKKGTVQLSRKICDCNFYYYNIIYIRSICINYHIIVRRKAGSWPNGQQHSAAKKGLIELL